MNRFLIPVVGFVALVALLVVGLGLNPREVPSPLVGKSAPPFQLARLDALDRRFALEEMRGQIWLLNVWASWCVACRIEHPLLVEMSKAKVIPLIGLNYKDQPNDAQAWLKQHGDPYQLSAVDADGRVGIDYGVYGVPETFLIDQSGVIRYKHIGPITPDSLERKLMPMIRSLQALHARGGI